MFRVLRRALCFSLLFFEHRNMQINRCYSLFFWCCRGIRVRLFCEVRRTQELLWRTKERETKGRRERADIKDSTQTTFCVFTNRQWTEQIMGRQLRYSLSWEGLSKSLLEALELLCHCSYQIPHNPWADILSEIKSLHTGQMEGDSVINVTRWRCGDMETNNVKWDNQVF